MSLSCDVMIVIMLELVVIIQYIDCLIFLFLVCVTEPEYFRNILLIYLLSLKGKVGN